MKKKRKIIIFITIIALVVTGVIAAVVILNCRNARIQEELRQEELRQAYRARRSAFGGLFLGHIGTGMYTHLYAYVPINIGNPNVDGIEFGLYIDLTLFRHETGINLTYEDVIEYLSQEFEEDGEVRIFTNGRHPEIAAFIEWKQERSREEIMRFEAQLDNIYRSYVNEARKTQIFPTAVIHHLPTEMIDELLRKAFNPDYEMDLIGIQNRWIAEGRARVYVPPNRDETRPSIEFFE